MIQTDKGYVSLEIYALFCIPLQWNIKPCLFSQYSPKGPSNLFLNWGSWLISLQPIPVKCFSTRLFWWIFSCGRLPDSPPWLIQNTKIQLYMQQYEKHVIATCMPWVNKWLFLSEHHITKHWYSEQQFKQSIWTKVDNKSRSHSYLNVVLYY